MYNHESSIKLLILCELAGLDAVKINSLVVISYAIVSRGGP